MRVRTLSVLIGVLLLLNACAALPTGPHVLVLPQAGTPLEEFQRDDRECQGYASGQLPTGAQAGTQSTATLQWRYDVAYVQCMYAKGHRVPGDATPRLSPQTAPPLPLPSLPRP
jgi:hypothetical protein